MRRWTDVLFALTVLLALSGHGDAAAVDAQAELDEDHSLKSQLVTPHTPWGKGYAKGKVSALFVVNSGHYSEKYLEPGTKLREVVELMQRFDVDGEAIFVGPKGEFYKGKDGEARGRRLLEKEYDVYVFAGAPFEAFSPELQYKMLERVVQKGAGLVCSGPKPKNILTPKRVLSPIPGFLFDGVPVAELALRRGIIAEKDKLTDDKAAARLLTCYKLGKGRGVSLNYSAHALAPNIPFTFPALTEYDYWMLLVGRTVLWAAGREPEVELKVSPAQVALDEAAGKQLTATLTSRSEKPLKLQVACSLRRSDGLRTDLVKQTVALAPQTTAQAAITLPRLRADRYFLDVLVSGQASGAGALVITSPVGVESIATDAPFVERGQSVNLSVATRGTLATADRLRVSLRDCFGRDLVRKEIAAEPGKAEYRLQLEVGDWASILMRAEAALIRDGHEVGVKETSFLVPKRRRGQFNFVQWAARNDVLEYYAWQKLGEAGWKVTLGGATDALAACDVSTIPYATRIVEEHDKDGVMKPVCWNDEPKVSEYIRGIVEKQAKHRQHGAFVYSLGDEGTTKGCCVHPACLAAYRKYLAKQYGTVERLNASWGAAYKSFDEVDLLDRKDILEGGAVGKGMFARWYDRQAFSRYNLAQFTHRFVEAFKTLDPQSITGFEGTGGFGDDYDTLLDAMTFWSPYPSIGDDILRGVARREHIRANWMGYQKKPEPLISYSWRMVMKEMDSIWWWRYDGVGSWRGYISPTLDFWPATQQVCDEMRPVRDGLGDVLLHSRVKPSGIAIFYSLPSALSGQLGDSASFGAPKRAHENWLRATYDLGLDPRYVTSKMLKSGALSSGEFKLLLLPMTQAIGADEAAAIRKFAEDGGMVLADLRPGIFDEHCKPLAAGALDDLFGIKRTGTGKAEKSPLDISVPLGGKSVSLKADDTLADPFVAAATATAMARAGNCPAVLTNRVGKGQALLLNFDLPGRQTAILAHAADTYGFLRALYGLAGVKAAVTATSADSGALPGVETRVWENAEATIFGLWHETNIKFFGDDGMAKPGSERKARVALPDKRYVYDLRAGKALGRTSKVDTTIFVGRANFFAALPYEIDGVKLRAASSAPKPGETLKVGISLDIPKTAKATHAVHVEVLDPSGKATPWGKRVVLLPGGQGEIALPIAWNDAPGKWRLRATELFSRESAGVSWVVR